MEIDPKIRAYYERGKEAARLSGDEYPAGPLELVRTQEIINRHLPPTPLQILDVGGGPGEYAAWLAQLGHTVHVVDPIALHVEQARSAHADVTTEIGDARRLKQDDGSVDVVLLLGPLYHLVDRADRIKALAEAKRVLRPGGMLFAAAISRFAALLDILVRLRRLHEPDVLDVVMGSVKTGVFRGPGEAELFTTAYFHLPRELREEVSEAGFELLDLLSIEGPAFMLADLASQWEFPDRRDTILQVAHLVESEPEMLAASSHLMAVGRAPI